ncbi:GNAT family N-acetyltransferase [Mycoplana dimorpha]|uniref:RimJ/RimL family protein N-acetyltransferase n=1 Tax=Mycoplana dimorpha TaxID=28320 RepID=A0A2T5B5V8_MYCDI|nr:GNAT family protein [Mycoplana dimorpha]PTM94352.1 RimJ/RimL family protein N-acetyltransferase [Mycoplana dimorpha]
MTVLLRPYVAADFAALRNWFPDEASVVQWAGPDMRFPLDPAQFSEMQQETEGAVPGRWMFSGLVGDTLAAHAQVALDWQHGVARLARVAVSPEFRGKRLAQPFLRQVVDRVFAQEAFVRLELNVYTFNAAAIATYMRLGFVEEGVRRSSVRVGAERWDTAILALLRQEYDVTRGSAADDAAVP